MKHFVGYILFLFLITECFGQSVDLKQIDSLANYLDSYKTNPKKGFRVTDSIYRNVKDLNGEVYHGGAGSPARIDISDQPKGVYYVRMETAGSIKTEKMVIQ